MVVAEVEITIIKHKPMTANPIQVAVVAAAGAAQGSYAAMAAVELFMLDI